MATKSNGHKPAKPAKPSKERRDDGREKMTFRLPESIVAALVRIARSRKEDREFPWEKQDIVEQGLRLWFQKYKQARP